MAELSLDDLSDKGKRAVKRRREGTSDDGWRDDEDEKVNYIRKRAFDKQHYMKLAQGYLAKFGAAGRSDFDRLLLDKISDALGQEQKRNFITNLLQVMRRKEIIRPVGGKRGKGAQWELYKPPTEK